MSCSSKALSGAAWQERVEEAAPCPSRTQNSLPLLLCKAPCLIKCLHAHIKHTFVQQCFYKSLSTPSLRLSARNTQLQQFKISL